MKHKRVVVVTLLFLLVCSFNVFASKRPEPNLIFMGEVEEVQRNEDDNTLNISTSPLSDAKTISCSIPILLSACSIAPIPLKTVASLNITTPPYLFCTTYLLYHNYDLCSKYLFISNYIELMF